MSKKGTYYIKDLETGRTFFIEVIDDHPHRDWGLYNTEQSKYIGSITSKESVIKTENGFTNIATLPPGHNPLDYVQKLLNQNSNRNDLSSKLEISFVETEANTET